jgi:scyllo-inositol 2-dehydrogenase (NADP+)
VRAPLRLGLIGAGDVVRRFYLPALAGRPGLMVQAIASAGGRSAAELAAQHAIPVVCDGVAALLRRTDVDAVAVCTPPDAHRGIAAAALRRGKHVLVEKPITASAGDCAALAGVAARRSAILYYTFNNRLREENRHLTERVLGGTIGALEAIDVEWLRTKPVAAAAWCRDTDRAGGGVLADLGSHLIMIALGLVPARRRFVAQCAASRRSGRTGDPEDVAVGHVVIDGHLPLTIRTGWGMALDRPAIVGLRAFGRAGMATNLDYEGPKSDGYGAVLDAFAAHIRARRQPDLGIMVDTMRLLGALLASGRTGRPVTGRFRGGGWS